MLVTREVSLGKVHPGIVWGRFVVSPDSKRMAYVKRGNKLLVVVDGEEGKEYDGIDWESLIFSPDSKRVAYYAKRGNKLLVVVDGEEGKEYDRLYGGKLVFDSPNLLHTLELRDDEIFHVEIEIVEE